LIMIKNIVLLYV